MLVTGPAIFALLVVGFRLTAAFVTGEGPDENHCVGVALVVPPWITSVVNAVPPVAVTVTLALPVKLPANRTGGLTPARLPPNVMRNPPVLITSTVTVPAPPPGDVGFNNRVL